jgi:hypothetical protein
MLPTDYSAVFACVGLGALLVIGALNRRVWLKAAAFILSIGLIVFHIFAWHVQYLWLWVFPHPSVVMISDTLVVGPIAAVIIGLGQYVPKLADRRMLVLFALVAIIYCGTLARHFIPPVRHDSSNWSGNTLLQSSDSTCIAAAGATYLRTLGVAATEGECVHRGLISRDGGSDLNAWRMLRLSLPKEYGIRAAPVTVDEITRDEHWFMVPIELTVGDAHEVVIKAAPDGSQADARDPMVGAIREEWDTIEKAWFRRAVWAEKR